MINANILSTAVRPRLKKIGLHVSSKHWNHMRNMVNMVKFRV